MLACKRGDAGLASHLPATLKSYQGAHLGVHQDGFHQGDTNTLESVPDLEKAMYFNAHGYPCVRLLNLSGEIGCSNPGQEKIVAPIFRQVNIDKLVVPSFAVLTPLEELENLLLRHVQQLIGGDSKLAQKIAGILVEATGLENRSLGFSPDEKFPQAEFAPYQNLSFEWNPRGSGIMWKRYSFPIFLLSNESTKALQEMATQNEKNYKAYPSNVAEFDLVMQTTKSENHDSTSCLKEQSCLPLGGYSVWSALPPIYTGEPPKSILLVMASMDSGSFFRDISFGADSSLSGLIALLAAVDAISQVSNLNELKKQLIFGVFTGEAWGYLGSKRFLLELDLGADSLKGLNSAMIEQVFEIGSVGKALNQGITTFFTHSGQDTPSTNEILDALQKASESLGSDNVNIKKADATNPGVPPSSLMSFLRKNSSISGVVLEDFDTSFVNKFYHSHLDNHANIDATSIAAAAIIVARALYVIASDVPLNLIVLNSIKVNVSLVDELVGCLLTCDPGLSCGIVNHFISPSSVCPNHYVGVFVDTPSETQRPQFADDTSRFVWNFLADRTSAPKKNLSPCKGECSGPSDVCVGAETESSRCGDVIALCISSLARMAATGRLGVTTVRPVSNASVNLGLNELNLTNELKTIYSLHNYEKVNNANKMISDDIVFTNAGWNWMHVVVFNVGKILSQRLIALQSAMTIAASYIAGITGRFGYTDIRYP
ncbi:Nicastrin [Platanthera zijinensis]|uniref:Nicastrin n=1 Tax=Platanthera zijinensis TaxID=2320716 RepID=A0AAP0FZJ1_9ASPA